MCVVSESMAGFPLLVSSDGLSPCNEALLCITETQIFTSDLQSLLSYWLCLSSLVKNAFLSLSTPVKHMFIFL